MKRLLSIVVISLFFYIPCGFAFTVEVPEAKGALPDDFITYVWKFEADESQLLNVELESPDGWQIQGNVERKLSILPNVPSFLAVSLQVPRKIFEGSYADSLVLKVAEERYAVTTEVGFVSGLIFQADSFVAYNGETTLWSVDLHNTGNGGDVYTIEVGRGDQQQSRQVNLAANESAEVFLPIGVGYQAYRVSSLRDETLIREGRVHVQNNQFRQFASGDEPYSLRTQFSSEYSTKNNSTLDFRLHGNVSDYVYSDYKLLYTQKTVEDVFEPNNLSSSLRLEGIEENWFLEGDIAKEKLEFAGGFSDAVSSVVVSSDLLKLQTQISAQQVFSEQRLVAGLKASVNLPDDSFDSVNLSTQEVSNNVNVLDVDFYASQVFGGGSRTDVIQRISEEELELLNLSDTELGLNANIELSNLEQPSQTQTTSLLVSETSEASEIIETSSQSQTEPINDWLSDVTGDWNFRFGVQSKTFEDYDLNLRAQTAIQFDEVESRLGLKVDQVLSKPNVELNAALNYYDLNSTFTLFPTAEPEDDYWRFSLNYQYLNSNNRFQLNSMGDWSLRNSLWWSVLNGFTLKFVNELKTINDELSFEVDISALNFQNSIYNYEALPFLQFSTAKLEEAMLGVDFKARALLGSDTSVSLYWLPFDDRFGTNISSELYFNATKYTSELRYSNNDGLQQVGAKLNIIHPLIIEEDQSVNLIGNIGFNTSLLNETLSVNADQVFSIPELADSQTGLDVEDSDWYVSVGLKWNDTTTLPDNIVELFGGRKSAVLSGKVDVIGAAIPENLVIKAGSHELLVDSNGYFSKTLPEGSYTLSIDPNSIPSGFFAGRNDITVNVGQALANVAYIANEPEVLLTLLAASTVRGSLSVPETLPNNVSSRSKKILPQVIVDFKNQTGQTLSLSSDAKGEFQLDKLRPGIYDISVRVPDGWQAKQQNFQFSVAAGEVSSFEIELFPKLVEQRSFQPDRVRIRDVILEVESVPPGSKPLIEVIVRGEASQVSVLQDNELSQGNNLIDLEINSNGVWQGRVSVPKTAKNFATFDVLATDEVGNETKFPLLVTVEESALWGVASLPQAVLMDSLVEVRVHWFTDDIIESQLSFMDRDYLMQGSGADWQTQFKIEAEVDQATRLPITFSAKRSDDSIIELKRILVVQPN